jgi:hypothetical protein
VNRVEVSQVKVGQRTRAIDPGGMDDDVQMPEVVLGGVEKGSRRRLVGDVGGE